MGSCFERATCAHLQVAVIITLVGLMESIAVAKALAERNGYDLDANQELAGVLMQCVASAHWVIWERPCCCIANCLQQVCIPQVCHQQDAHQELTHGLLLLFAV